MNFTATRLRWLIQSGFAFFCVYTGYEFHRFFLWAMGQSETFAARPPAVEAFLPISAFMAFRRYISTGLMDDIHPAGLILFIAFISMAFMFRKGFCAYICPVGFLSNLLEEAGKKLGISKTIPKRIDFPLTLLKYGLMGFFTYTIFFGMSLDQLNNFLNAPYNMVADGKLYLFFTNPSNTALAIMGGLAVISMFIKNFWCRYLCPYGALLGILASCGPFAIHRKEESCIDCGKCTKNCPVQIDVQAKVNVRSPECIGCMRCAEKCPVENCLTMSYRGFGSLPFWGIAAGSLITLGILYSVALYTDNWISGIPTNMLQTIYMRFMQ
ncbi:MAG: 4Fe-4S binding protein [Desulfovibrio sp.]